MSLRVAAYPGAITHTLGQIPLFQVLVPAALEALARQIQVQTYQRGAPVALAPESVYVVAHGSVRLYRLDASGHALTLRSRRAGEAFAVLPGDHVQVCAAATCLYALPRSAILRLQEMHPAFAHAISRLLSQRLAEAYARMEDLALGSLAVRLARVLARLAQEHSERRVSLSHEEMADLLGTRREQITKTLRAFRARGLVASDVGPAGLVVCDPARLLALADEPGRSPRDRAPDGRPPTSRPPSACPPAGLA